MLTIVEVPFHMGLEGVAVGRGPGRFLEEGLDSALARRFAPEVVHIRKRDATAVGMDAIVDVNRQVRYAARAARQDGSLAIVLSGNCNACLGTLAGFEGARAGVVWLDAHPDFNTPDTSRSGNLDGMALAAAIGDCHEQLRERIGGEFLLEAGNVLLLGVRDIENLERLRLNHSGMTVRPFGENLDDLEDLLKALAARVDAIYLHIDIDVLNPAESPGVNYRGAGGYAVAELERILKLVARLTTVAAVGLTNYNPEQDVDDRTLAAGMRLLQVFVKD